MKMGARLCAPTERCCNDLGWDWYMAIADGPFEDTHGDLPRSSDSGGSVGAQSFEERV